MDICLPRVDHFIALCLVPLAAWILLSGLDDLSITAIFALAPRRCFRWPPAAALDRARERPIAILVPLWREHQVIGRMLESNLAVIRYANYQIFAGVYPNDEFTARAVAEIAARHPRVHMAVCPHDGPTSKGDCLNWIYREMEKYEARHGVRFEIVMTHDAEDLVHPESLRMVNWFSRAFDMVQIPVLPLATGLREFTHGLYCDEFAEFQLKDIPVRQVLGGFLPSNGVGTGFGRAALERLAQSRQGRIFDPECLTEDYENGFCIHAQGGPQIFVPLHFDGASPVATREYFPHRFRAAVRQRGRWVAGISLQGWQRHGWRGGWRQCYWFWRDRKGLVGNLLSPLTNLITLYGLATWAAARWGSGAWGLGADMPSWAGHLYTGTLAMAFVSLGVRVRCSAEIFGWRFASLAPLRAVWGNIVNFTATAAALRQFTAAAIRRGRLAWRKTEHHYPLTAAGQARPRLGEVLVRMRCLLPEELERAMNSAPRGVRIGQHLLAHRLISEEHLYRALSAQAGIPLGVPHDQVRRPTTRMLPATAVRRWQVMPYRVSGGQLHLLTADVPGEEMTRELKRLSRLDLQFRLVRPAELAALAQQYLPQSFANG